MFSSSTSTAPPGRTRSSSRRSRPASSACAPAKGFANGRRARRTRCATGSGVSSPRRRRREGTGDAGLPVIAGRAATAARVVPAIPISSARPCHVNRDARDKPGHDDVKRAECALDSWRSLIVAKSSKKRKKTSAKRSTRSIAKKAAKAKSSRAKGVAPRPIVIDVHAHIVLPELLDFAYESSMFAQVVAGHGQGGRPHAGAVGILTPQAHFAPPPDHLGTV